VLQSQPPNPQLLQKLQIKWLEKLLPPLQHKQQLEQKRLGKQKPK
jgi:hypothetical protein